ncbi:hypothetical protein P7C70_g2303, partial [Phenoliferia sp. Uapishka_3]
MAPEPPGCGCFHPDGHSFWARLHDTSLSERKAVTNAFLHEFADIITPQTLPPELRCSERGKVHLTPLTTPLGSYWVSPTVLHQVYQMNAWFDDNTMDAALSTINFWLGWTAGVVGWTPEAYVLPVGWKEDIAGVYFATDVRLPFPFPAVDRQLSSRRPPQLFLQTLLSRCRYIIAPCHVGGNHWILVVATRETESFQVFDSLNTSEGASNLAAVAISVGV